MALQGRRAAPGAGAGVRPAPADNSLGLYGLRGALGACASARPAPAYNPTTATRNPFLMNTPGHYPLRLWFYFTVIRLSMRYVVARKGKSSFSLCTLIGDFGE